MRKYNTEVQFEWDAPVTEFMESLEYNGQEKVNLPVSGQNPPGQNPPGQNPPDKIPLDKIPPRTKSP